MKKRINQLAAVVLTITFLAAVGIAQCSDADKKALEAFDRAWGDAGRAGDRAALELIYADDHTGFGLLRTLDRKQAIDNAVNAAERRKSAVSQNQSQVSSDHYIISCTPNTGTITHRVVAKTMTDGKESVSYSRSVHFLVKNGGRWQVVSDIGDPTNERRNLIYKHISGYNAFMNRDIKWFEKNMDDNYIGVSSTGTVTNKAQTIESIKNNKNKYESIRLSRVMTNVDGKMAVVTGVYHIKGQTADGKPIDMKLRFTRTLAKKHGNWVAIAAQTSVVTDN